MTSTQFGIQVITICAWQDVMPLIPFLPIEILIRCSFSSIFFPTLSACSQAIAVNWLLHAVATASLSGTNWYRE